MPNIQKHLFTPGPVNMPEVVRQAVNQPMQDHRAPDFHELVHPVLNNLKDVFRTKDGHVMIFSGSGTSGWEGALNNCLNPGAKLLTSRYGHFSHLWIEMCKQHGFDIDVIDAEWGMTAPIVEYAKILEADKSHKIEAVLICHNETATGVVSDVAGLREVLDNLAHPALLFVDGVSSIGSLEFRMDDWGVDVAVCGSQKGFMLPTGLAILGISQKAMDVAKTAKSHRSFMDFHTMLASNETGYFPYTPATTLIHGLGASVKLLLDEGMDIVAKRHHHLAEGVRAAINAWGLELCAKDPKYYSDVVSTIVVPEAYDSNAIVGRAYDRYHLSLGGGLARLAGKVYRIGHLGCPTELMMLMAISGAEMAMVDCGLDIALGSGVGAAQTKYRELTVSGVV